MYNYDVMKNQNLYRTQVLLEPEQVRQLTELAEAEGVSLSALLRRLIARALEERRRQELARAAENMLEQYYSDGEMVGYATLDNDDFPLKG
jgi:exoribonuclease R